MMWPMPGAMALSEHLLGLSLVATPLQLAGVNPIAAYNVCLLLTYALSGFFAFLLGRRLTGSTFAGVCAGLAFGFSPYRASQLAHIQVLSSQWMPLALLGLHAYVSSGARRWLVVFGAAWVIQALSNGYFLLFFPVLVVAWLAWFVDWRKAPGRGLAIVAAWAIASLPLLPVLLKYREVHEHLGLTRKVAEIREFSAVPASFLHAAPLMRFWREGPARQLRAVSVHGRDGRAAGARRARPPPHQETPAATATAGRAPIIFYAAATLLMWVLALGPGGEGQEPASLCSSLQLAARAAGLQRPARVIALCDGRHAVPRDRGEPRRRPPVEADGQCRPLARARRRRRRRWPRGRRDDAPGPGRSASRESDPPWFATGGGDGVAARQH